MGETKVAEGPLIRHVPGGFAEFLQKESGLPPARLRSGEDEWWGRLVEGPTPSLKEPIVKPDTTDTTDTGTTGTPSPAPDFDPDDLTRDWSDYSVGEQYDVKQPTIDWWKPGSVDLTTQDDPDITGYGWGVPTQEAYGPHQEDDPRYQKDRDFRFYKHPGVPQQPKTLVPGGQAAGLISGRGPVGTIKPLDELPTKGLYGAKEPFKFYEHEGPKATVGDAVVDVFKGIESMADAIFGKTSLDQYPRPPKEKEVIRQSKKLEEWFEGFSEEEFLLWETEGVPGGSLTGREPFGPKYGKTLANLGRIIQNKDNIEIQEMGNLQWIAIMNAVKLFEMYGPLGAAFPLAATIIKDTLNALNSAFADHPIFAGNPIQDVIYGTTWVSGKILQKTYNATLGKILPKIKNSNIKEKFSKLNIFDYNQPTGTSLKPKITTTGPTAGSEHLQPHDPLDLGTATQQPGEQVTAEVTGEQPTQPTGREISPILVDKPTGEAPKGTISGKPPTQTRPTVEQLPTKTITGPLGEFPQGEQPTTTPLPTEKPEGTQQAVEQEAAIIADEIMGATPTGDEPFVIKGDYQPKPEPEVEPKVEPKVEPEVKEPPELDLPELDPETLKKLEEEDIKPTEDPIEPFATYSVMARVPVDESGEILDYNNPADMERLDRIEDRLIEFPDRGKNDPDAGREQSDHENRMNEIELDLQFKQPDPDPTSPTEPEQQDFRSDHQKELGLTVGNQWVDESDRSTWPAIAATQRPQWNERTQQFDLMYNRNLPQSNIPDHPQYYGNNPEYVGNVTPDVNVEIKPVGGKEEIFNWSDQAGLNPTIFKPIYNNDYQFIGNEMFTLETESYPKGDGWGYRYRYNSAESGERGEWHEWVPGP